MKRMLINATQPEERRLAIVDTEGGRQPTPVLQYVARVVAHAQAQVQRRVGPGRHPS